MMLENFAPVRPPGGVSPSKGQHSLYQERFETRSRKEIAMKVTTSVKAGGIRLNRSETLQRKETALVVKTNVKAGGLRPNRCETLHRRAIAKSRSTS